MSSKIYIKDYCLTIDDILNEKYKNLDISEYLQNTILFCKNWILKQQTFKVNTSGSTGKPKEIILNRTEMEISASKTISFLSLPPKSNSLVCISTEYIGGIMMLVRSLLFDFDMEIVEPSLNPLENIQSKLKFDFCALVPIQINDILVNGIDKVDILNNMKAIIIGGAKVDYSLENKINKIESPVYNTYGMTETISHIALKRLNGKEKSKYFKLLPNTKIKKDERGCLVINSEITKNKDLITNDIVNIISEKEFEWLGRIDNVINSGGHKVFVENVESELEKVFFQFNIKNNFFVNGLIDEKFGEIVTLFIEGNKIDRILENKIFDYLYCKLHKYDIPQKVYYLDNFKYTNSGKIDRINTVNLIK